MDLANIKTVDNNDKNQFELKTDGRVALISYKKGKSGDIYLVHTEVPNELEGQGVGHKLVRESLNLIETKGLKIIPLCPFIRSFLKENKDDFGHLLSERAKL